MEPSSFPSQSSLPEPEVASERFLLEYMPFTPSVEYRRWYGFKRVFDVILASLGLILFAPLFVLIAIAIKLTSPGPVLFRQERLSIYEKPFTLIKFRTMVDQAEAKTGPTWVQEGDTRITPIGRFLRKTHVDELPQLWNILLGEMSLIGPRPERPVFVKRFRDEDVENYSCRHFFRPGITGYAQMQNPNPTVDQIREKTDADLWYITNWSVKLELWLMRQTAVYFCRSLRKMIFRPSNPARHPDGH